jgi:hypothetical protein
MSKQRNKGETRRGGRSRGEEQTARCEPTRRFGQTFHTAVTILNIHRRRRRLKIGHRAEQRSGYVLANEANGAIAFSLREHGKALGPLCQSTIYRCACTGSKERSRMRQKVMLYCLFWPERGSENNRSRFGLGKVSWCDLRLVEKVSSRRFRQCMSRWLSSLVSEDLLEMVT